MYYVSCIIYSDDPLELCVAACDKSSIRSSVLQPQDQQSVRSFPSTESTCRDFPTVLWRSTSIARGAVKASGEEKRRRNRVVRANGRAKTPWPITSAAARERTSPSPSSEVPGGTAGLICRDAENAVSPGSDPLRTSTSVTAYKVYFLGRCRFFTERRGRHSLGERAA